jgi:putative hydrolase of the HAD superfamily
LIEAVLFDLDDTLFDQRCWLAGAWRAVTIAGTAGGLEGSAFHAALVHVAAEGSAKGAIIDRALARVGAASADVAPLVEAFKAHRPPRLPLYPGVRQTLERLRPGVALGLVTDGDPGIQRSKVDALGIADAFDVVVLSDELGRGRRKPHPAPFLAALNALGVDAGRAAFVGDRPETDIAGGNGVGLRTVRVRTGEYALLPDQPPPWRSAADVVEAVRTLEPLFAASRPLSDMSAL